MKKTTYYLKVAAAVLAVALLAKYLREWFNRSGEGGRDTSDVEKQPVREANTMEGEERTDRTTEREDEVRVQRTEEELRAGS
jgi:hypothetical protein